MHCSTCTGVLNCWPACTEELQALLISLCSKPEKARKNFNVIIILLKKTQQNKTQIHRGKQASSVHSLLPSLLSSFLQLQRGLTPHYPNWVRLNSRLSQMKETEILPELQQFSVLIIFYILSPLLLSFLKSLYWFLLSVPLPALPWSLRSSQEFK